MSAMQNQTVSGVDALSIDSDLVTGLLCGFVREEVGRVGFERVVLGLSGGVDSAVAAAIASRALGPERVVPVLMPYRTSAAASEVDARAVCAALGLEPVQVEITAQVDAYFERHPGADRGRRGNKMARERMSILYDLSVEHHALVMGTSNKTELLLGYGTLFGDLASALNPLGDLYKTQVFALGACPGAARSGDRQAAQCRPLRGPVGRGGLRLPLRGRRHPAPLPCRPAAQPGRTARARLRGRVYRGHRAGASGAASTSAGRR